MQLFKAFLKVAKKRLPSISIYLIIYVIMTFLMSITSQDNIDSNFQSKSLKISIIDEDESAASSSLVSYLGSLHELIPLDNDPELLQDNLYYRYIDYILTIPAGFEEKLESGDTLGLYQNVKVPGSARGLFIDRQVDQYTQTLQIYMAGGYTLTEATALTDEALLEAVPVKSLTFQDNEQPAGKEIFFFYRYLPYILICLLVCGLTPILVIFNDKNLLERTLCSSLSPVRRNVILAGCCVFYSLAVWITFPLLGMLAFRRDFFTPNALYAMFNSLVFLLFATALTLFISTFAPNFNVVNMAANIIGLGMAFLCGVFVDQYLLSDGVLKIARFLPVYWYVRANDMLCGLSTESFDLSFYWTALGIQLLFAAAFFAATLAASKLRRPRNSSHP